MSAMTPKQQLAAAIMKDRRLSAYLPFILGVWLESIFLGLIFIAFAFWLTSVSKTDRRWIQILVPAQIIFSAGFSAVCVAHWFHIFVRGFGDYTALLDPNGDRVSATVYFALRAYILLGRSKIFLIVIIPFAISAIVGGVYGTIIFDRIPATQPFLVCILVFSSNAVAADIIITSSLIFGLWRSKTGWEATDRLLKKLMVFAIETQLPPTLSSLGFLLTSCVQDDGRALGFFLFMPKISTLCLILAINSRVRLSKELSAQAGDWTAPKHSQGSAQSGPGAVYTDRTDEAEIFYIDSHRPLGPQGV